MIVLVTIVHPFLFAPTRSSIGLDVVLAKTDDLERARVLVTSEGDTQNRELAAKIVGERSVRFDVHGLAPATRHRYRVLLGSDEIASGSFVTARPAGTAFTFDIITDTHVFVRDFSPAEMRRFPLDDDELAQYTAQKAHAERVLPQVARNVAADAPDFLLHLGDVIDCHGLGNFNDPPPDPSFVARGFLDYRRLLGGLTADVPHVLALGNWDGENGDYTAAEIAASRAQRRIYLPNPGPTTYPEGGGPNDDYFAWTWGDALFVVLNVNTYTPTSHRLWSDPGLPDDWTLGADQLRWLESTLASSRARWKFLFIHHAVGGAGPDEITAAYGRGGGLAAHVGEQARVHALMREHGAGIFFYGHDHVFTDMVVDGIHYTLAGRAGTNWVFGSDTLGYARTWADSGHVRVRVEPERVRVELVNLERKVLYAYDL
jgi:3',5'-cyclic AMP phosphodiesterase CpdA